MRDQNDLLGRVRGVALAGALAAVTAVSPVLSVTAWAYGPGDTLTAPTTTSAGPGGPGATTNNNTTSNSTTTNNTSTNTSTTNPNAWKRVNGSYQMQDGTVIKNVLRRGIDVSRWQGDINWSKVAADDVSFVMLGTRSKGAVDPYFHDNIKEANAAGIKVGVYIYSLATTTDMAKAEADFVINLIKDYPVSYPVAFDMEDSTQGSLSKSDLAAIANAFCTRIKDAGYYPIIYANENWLANKLDMSKMNYPVWVARYNKMYTYNNPVMWQATSTGSINGISGNVDIDFQFKDFSSVIPANLWRTINGESYYYKDYELQKNTWVDDGKNWYFMDNTGVAKKGWYTESGKRYYLDESTGAMQKGWKSQDDKWYYLGSSGAASTGWINDGSAWYFMDRTSGVMKTGWLTDNGSTYYLDASGKMATGWKSESGKWYYLDASGAMQKGWFTDQGLRYYAGNDGVMKTGWLKDGNATYYLKGSGAMASGWREIDNTWYYFDGEGRMATGWAQVGSKWYYFDGNGRMNTGLITVNGVRYYLNADGAMAVSTNVSVDGKVYTADASGALSEAPEGTTAPETPNTEVTTPGTPTPGTTQNGPGGSGTSSPNVTIVPEKNNTTSTTPTTGSNNAPTSSTSVSGSNEGPGETNAHVTGVNGGPGVSMK